MNNGAKPNKIPSQLERTIQRISTTTEEIDRIRKDTAEMEQDATRSRFGGIFSKNKRKARENALARIRELQSLENEKQHSADEMRESAHKMLDEFLLKTDPEYRKISDRRVATEATRDHWDSVLKRIRLVVSAVGEAKNQMGHAYSQTKTFSPGTIRSFQKARDALETLIRCLSEFEVRIEKLGISTDPAENGECPKTNEIREMSKQCAAFSSGSYSFVYRSLESWAENLNGYLDHEKPYPDFIESTDHRYSKVLAKHREKWIAQFG